MPESLGYSDTFAHRHIGPTETEIGQMARALSVGSLEELVDEAIPAPVRTSAPLRLPKALTEFELLKRVRALAELNRPFRSFIGAGYSGTITPPVILRNIFENPSWYTQYTPYQAEIAQGRLEALLNFQTMIIDLTGMPIANASLLDEATAAAEAMMMVQRLSRDEAADRFFVSAECHPQTIEVVRARARPIDIDVVVGDHRSFAFDERTFGALLQYPTTDGGIFDYSAFCEEAHAAGARVVVAADLLALALLRPPGAFGADVVVGSAQRFGVPLGYGGPHAGYLATREAFKRQVPGRIIGVSIDAEGRPALRMALQTREQHIRRDKATSNICTAQVLLAIMAGAYAVWHGPEGLRRVAVRVRSLTHSLARGLRAMGHALRHDVFFDTIRVDLRGTTAETVHALAQGSQVNLRHYEDGSVGIALDETVSPEEVRMLLALFAEAAGLEPSDVPFHAAHDAAFPEPHVRRSPYLEHPVFNRYHSETEMMRYLHRLASRDLSLTTSMIPLGSCTMKLNAAAELMPVSMPQFGDVHPFAPPEQAGGYAIIIEELKNWLAEITGFAAVSLQPNSGASGEYAGLLTIRAYHRHNGEETRNVCLVPESAHGTNPASATMAGMKVVVVRTGERGDIDYEDLRAKAGAHADRLAALMITYPSTHGVFERDVRKICDVVHEAGGQVYMDGANMNAQVGLCRPGEIGADVCHLNLHKTFSIPHGGGGPGMGPVAVAAHLAPFLPGHPLVKTGGEAGIGPVAAAPYGSASILLISWAYIALMGPDGLQRASEVAVLNANYLAYRLAPYYDILYRGDNGRVAHEFILDLRPFRQRAGISELDVAKRLMDYGYHAPTMSWPVTGTMMIEPTESESKAELDRFCDTLISIRSEIEEIEGGSVDARRNVLKNAPHTMRFVLAEDWSEPYSREKGAFPAPWTEEHKFWPAVRRIDDAYGDRNLICACPPVEEYATETSA